MFDDILTARHDEAIRAQIRCAVGLLLDGVAPADDRDTVGAWLATETLQSATPSLATLLADRRPVIIASRCDRLHLTLSACAPNTIVARAVDGTWDGAWPLFLPCPGLHARVDPDAVQAILDGGGIVVTSDRALEAEPFRSIVPAGRRRPQRRARVATVIDLDAPIPPAVHLAAGYTPIEPSATARSGVQVLATDVLTDEPLVVLVRCGAGFLLHASPHWFQQECGWFTELERSSIGERPWARACWPGSGQLKVGDMLSALAMATVLRVGLSTAIEALSHGAGRSESGGRVPADARHIE